MLASAQESENGLCQEQHPDYARLTPELTTKFAPMQ